MSNFRTIDRQTGFLLPPSVDEWLREEHLARFVVEVVDGLDLRSMSGAYRGSGSRSYHPRLLLGVLVYGYATGVFSSRKLERATYDSVAFRFIAANEHPDHDTIATFRRRFLKEIEKLFVVVLQLAREMGVLKMGTIGLDGTKIHANASRHSALSYEHAGKIEAQLKAEVADLMAKAEAADKADIPDGMSIPDELMWSYYELVTDRTPGEIAALKQEVAGGTLHPMDAKMRLAQEVITGFHGDAAARKAADNFQRIFRDRQAPEEAPVKKIPVNGTRKLTALLVELQLVASKNEAIRLIEQGGVEIDGTRVDDARRDMDLSKPAEFLLRAGKKKFLRVVVE